MSPTKKKITIAEDVLASLKIKKYTATSGIYLNVDTIVDDENPQTLLQNKHTTCQVCAVGALFTSKVKVGNKFKQDLSSNDEVSDTTMISNLKGIFTAKELRLIECAFEGDTHGGGNRLLTEEEQSKAVDFYHKYQGSDARLKAIMKNIIKNKGNFVL